MSGQPSLLPASSDHAGAPPPPLSSVGANALSLSLCGIHLLSSGVVCNFGGVPCNNVYVRRGVGTRREGEGAGQANGYFARLKKLLLLLLSSREGGGGEGETGIRTVPEKRAMTHDERTDSPFLLFSSLPLPPSHHAIIQKKKIPRAGMRVPLFSFSHLVMMAPT